MDSKELTEWMAYARIEPFGQEMENWRAAEICCVLANLYRDPKKHPEPYKIADFMPVFESRLESEDPDPEQLLDKVKAIQAMFVALESS